MTKFAIYEEHVEIKQVLSVIIKSDYKKYMI